MQTRILKSRRVLPRNQRRSFYFTCTLKFHLALISLIESEAAEMNQTYFQALAFDKDLGATRGIDAALKEHNLDALVLPAPGFTTTPAGMEPRFWCTCT
jgi:hypothetical protein